MHWQSSIARILFNLARQARTDTQTTAPFHGGDEAVVVSQAGSGESLACLLGVVAQFCHVQTVWLQLSFHHNVFCRCHDGSADGIEHSALLVMEQC